LKVSNKTEGENPRSFYFSHQDRPNSPSLMAYFEGSKIRLRQEALFMNVQQRQAIHRLRGEGLSYAKISALTGISENTIKSFCRRNGLGSVATEETAEIPSGSFCRQCGSPLTQTKRAKHKRFCSDKCRMTWWNSHPDAVNHKLVRQITCQSCGKAFTALGNRTRKYCSQSCYAHAKVVRV